MRKGLLGAWLAFTIGACDDAKLVRDAGADAAGDVAQDMSTDGDAAILDARDATDDTSAEHVDETPIDAGPDAATPPTLDEFYARHRELVCQRAIECGAHLGIEIESQMVTIACRHAGPLVDRARLEASLARGSIVYDELGALECLDALTNLSCDEVFRSAAIECGAAFLGNVALGAPCGVHEDCFNGYCDVSAACPGAAHHACPRAQRASTMRSVRASAVPTIASIPRHRWFLAASVRRVARRSRALNATRVWVSRAAAQRTSTKLATSWIRRVPRVSPAISRTSAYLLSHPVTLAVRAMFARAGTHASATRPAVPRARYQANRAPTTRTAGADAASSTRVDCWTSARPAPWAHSTTTPIVFRPFVSPTRVQHQLTWVRCVATSSRRYVGLARVRGEEARCLPDCPTADESPPALSWGKRWGGTLSDTPWTFAATTTGLYAGGVFLSSSADFGTGTITRMTATLDAAFLAGYLPSNGLASDFGARMIDGDLGSGGDVVLGIAVDGDVHVVGTMIGSADFGGATTTGGRGFYARYSAADGTLVTPVFRLANTLSLSDVAAVGGHVFVAGTYSATMGVSLIRCGGGTPIALPGGSSELRGFVAELGNGCAIAAASLGVLHNSGTLIDLAVAPDASELAAGWRVGSPDPDIALGVLSGDLSTLHTHTYASTADDTINDLAIDAEGALYLVGQIHCAGTLQFDDGPRIQITGTPCNIATSRGFAASLTLDDPPRHRWTRVLGDVPSSGHWLSITPDGDIVLGGIVNRSQLGFSLLTTAGAGDAFVARLSPLGAHRWSFSFGGGAFDSSVGGALLPDGSLFLAVTTTSTSVRIASEDLSELGNNDLLMVGSLPP